MNKIQLKQCVEAMEAALLDLRYGVLTFGSASGADIAVKDPFDDYSA